jgi:8-oxo-dGTP pyrophosphatase MutT (NUDIX family)
MHLIDRVASRLSGPLPGVQAHRQFVPADMPGAADRLQQAPEGARRSAVLVPLLLRADDDVDVLFTLRTSTMRSHRGQISFPGGRVDDGEDAITAALREMYEETGVEAHDVTVLGSLSSIWVPPSNSAITPIVGLVRPPERYVPSEAEVEEIFTVPLSTLMDDASIHVEPWVLYERTVNVRHWRVHPRVPLWGATAMILNELLMLLSTESDPTA